MVYKKNERFNITEVKPSGWLLEQLKIQMNGLSGILYDIWESVGSYSGWLGGTGDGWERVPYYLDGLVPLSYYLDDKEHWDICMRFIEWTLNSQEKTGNFGPSNTKNDQWSRYAMLKVLIQYYEITTDARVLTFVYNYLHYFHNYIMLNKLENWSKARVPDLLYVLKWLYEKTEKKELLDWQNDIDNASFNWNDYLSNFPFPKPTSYYINWKNVIKLNPEIIDKFVPYHATHIVNVTMGLKHPALQYYFSGNEICRESVKKGIGDLIKHHGVVSGCINGDEHLAGNSPTAGAELCSVVEYLFSLQSLMEIFGDSYYGDLVERLAYNALPATISEDFMSHQYLQQANQIVATDDSRPWFNNTSNSNTFGLEPHFGCCTANMHQGWPKFVQSLWYKQNDKTLVNFVLAPSILTTNIDGEELFIEVITDYPFRDQLVYRFNEVPSVNIECKIRIPSWCTEPQVSSNKKGFSFTIEHGFIHINKQFEVGEEIRVQLPMELKYTKWYNDSVSFERGPLVYGLDMEEEWNVIKEFSRVKDYEVVSKTPWNYAISEKNKVVVEEFPLTIVPFSKKSSPVRLKTVGKKLSEWKMVHNSAGPMPKSPVDTSEDEENITLIPFGCTKLRVSQFPYYT